MLQGASVQALALNKGLDAEWLETFLGWEDTKWYQTPSVLIRYLDEDNENPILRHRVGIDNGERFRWERFSEGQRTRPYGLWTLDWAKQKGYIVLVEGETDFATLLYNDIPALGNSRGSILEQRLGDLPGGNRSGLHLEGAGPGGSGPSSRK